jgi:dienelactone hydrolase
MRPALPRLIVALAALAAIGAALWQLRAQSAGLVIEAGQAGTVPLTVYRPAAGAPAPAIVIAHGFAGSRQLMQPFATTLARRGYVAVVFDFPGHARNPVALAAGLEDRPVMQGALLDTLDAVVGHARALPGTDGRVAVLGHSMAADVVVRYGHAHPGVAATVAVSLFVPEPHAWNPRNLLIIDGALESPMLRDQGLATIAAAVGGPVAPGATYGDFADGSARRIVFARGVEHIGVLYSGDSLGAAADWFDRAFDRPAPVPSAVDGRGPWLGVLFLGVVALAWPLAGLLPRVAAPAPRAPAGWRWLLPVALVPALATPLLLRAVPVSFLPLLLGDYLILHFGLYGLLTVGMIALLRRRLPEAPALHADFRALALAAALVAGFSGIAIAWPIDAYVFSMGPAPWRLPLVALLALGILPWFLADEWLTRRLAPMRGAYAFTKACFLLSLVLAIALDLRRLFFLVILVPAILLLFGVYGAFSAWVNRRTGHPLPAAIAHALVFAWFIGMTFPVVD